MEIEILADEEPRARTRPPVVGAVQVVARQAEIREEDRGSSAEPVIELGEDLSPRASSVPSMTAEDFAILEMVRPDYPEASVLQNIEGRIRIRARVDGSGSVVDIWVVDTEVDVFIEASVRHAVRQWRFKPYRRGGRSLPFTVLVPFRFELED
jgi:protein TonB